MHNIIQSKCVWIKYSSFVFGYSSSKLKLNVLMHSNEFYFLKVNKLDFYFSYNFKP